MTELQIKKLIERTDFLQELLSEFGLTLSGYDPDVLAVVSGVSPYDDRHTFRFGPVEWKWLEPLLVELRAARSALEDELKPLSK